MDKVGKLFFLKFIGQYSCIDCDGGLFGKIKTSSIDLFFAHLFVLMYKKKRLFSEISIEDWLSELKEDLSQSGFINVDFTSTMGSKNGFLIMYINNTLKLEEVDSQTRWKAEIRDGFAQIGNNKVSRIHLNKFYSPEEYKKFVAENYNHPITKILGGWFGKLYKQYIQDKPYIKLS